MRAVYVVRVVFVLAAAPPPSKGKSQTLLAQKKGDKLKNHMHRVSPLVD